MNPARGDPDDCVPCHHLLAIDDGLSLHHTHGEAGQIQFSIFIEPWHLCGFSAQQSATGKPASLGNPLHHHYDRLGGDLAGGDIVEKK